MTQIPPEPDYNGIQSKSESGLSLGQNQTTQTNKFEPNSNKTDSRQLLVDAQGEVPNQFIQTQAIDVSKRDWGQSGNSYLPSDKSDVLKPQQGDRQNSLAQWFKNLSIRRKQSTVLFASQIITISGLVGIGAYLITQSNYRQLIERAESELIVTEINYGIKIDQMGFGFRGQSDNAAIIEATQLRDIGQPIPETLQNRVKQILQNEINARNIEYATLVGRNGRIIVNANQNQTGELFDPQGLVGQVVQNPQQIKTTEIISWSEIEREQPPLPAGFENKDGLIRYTVTPVLTPTSGTVIGALVSGDLVNNKTPIVQKGVEAFGNGYEAVYQVQPSGEFVLATSIYQSDDLKDVYRNIPLTQSNEILAEAVAAGGEIITERTDIEGNSYTIAAKSIENNQGEPVAVLVRGTPATDLNNLLINSLLLQLLVALLAVALTLVLATLLGRAIAKPLEKLTYQAKRFVGGDRNARVAVASHDDIGQLSHTFNQMAQLVQVNETQLLEEAQRSQLIKDLALKINNTRSIPDIIKYVVDQGRQTINSDRVVYYQFDQNWQGKVVEESVVAGYPQARGAEIADPCFAEGYVEKYQQGRIQAIPDIYQAGLTQCHLQQLEPFEVKANLVTPVLMQGKLVGLLIAHQCSAPRNWSESDISFFAEVANQLSIGIDRANFIKQQEKAQANERAAKEQLQRRALELLMEVDSVSRGDLTIRAKVREDEIGTIADSYNATIESLGKLVTQVKEVAQLLTNTTSQKELAVEELSNGAMLQTQEIAKALDKIQTMSNSINAVASNALEAESAVQVAASTVKAGDDAMNRTVEGFEAIRNTVAETSKKLKRLGESSQKISKVVNLISNFAEQTNLLALNASIEAAHAGEEGRGFAVVAEEVRTLARQSAEASAEIESLVAEIQSGTNEVVVAMETGTEQVVNGTKLVDETRENLIRIANVSDQINQLVVGIAEAAAEQAQDSHLVTQTMTQVANISTQTTKEANEVSESFKELLAVAQELQQNISKFKVQ